MYLLIAIFTYDKSENGMETNKGNGQQKNKMFVKISEAIENLVLEGF